MEYYKGRYFGEAAKLAGKALEIDDKDLNGMFLAIKAYQVAGEDKTAFDIARRAVQRFPDSARANFEYAYHLQKEGQIAEAEQRLQRAMKADPSYEEPFFFYGNLLVDQERTEEAIPFLEKAIQNRHDYVPARVVLGARPDESEKVSGGHCRAERNGRSRPETSATRTCSCRRSTSGWEMKQKPDSKRKSRCGSGARIQQFSRPRRAGHSLALWKNNGGDPAELFDSADQAPLLRNLVRRSSAGSRIDRSAA